MPHGAYETKWPCYHPDPAADAACTTKYKIRRIQEGGMYETHYYLTNRLLLTPFSRLSLVQNGAFWWGRLMNGQLMHSTKMLQFGLMRAEKMALTRIYKRVSYIPLKLRTYWSLYASRLRFEIPCLTLRVSRSIFQSRTFKSIAWVLTHMRHTLY
jgi:hypothetical protein